MRAAARNHILMVLENNPYPQDGRVRREAQALTDAGYRVTVIAPLETDQARSEWVDGVRVLRFRLPPEGEGLVGFGLEYASALAGSFVLALAAFIRVGFSAIHLHNPPDLLFLVAMWYRLAGVRVVFDHHDLSPEMYRARFGSSARPVLYRALRGFERMTFRVADHVIASNESYAEVARTRGGVPDDRITVVRNGPDPNRVRPLPPDPDLRARAPFVFGFVGEMAPQDGVDGLVRSLALVKSEFGRSDWVCVLIGSGSELDRLRALAASHGIAERMIFTGRITDPDTLMAKLSAADICMTPDPSNEYTDRSTMVKMAEYMALGKPVVAFDLPEHRRTAGEAASYAEANDERDFARCIVELMDDPERRARMGEIGMQRVEDELAWPHQAGKLVAAYDTILAQGGGADG